MNKHGSVFDTVKMIHDLQAENADLRRQLMETAKDGGELLAENITLKGKLTAAAIREAGLREMGAFLIDAVERLNKTHPSDVEGRLRRWEEVFGEVDRMRAALADPGDGVVKP